MTIPEPERASGSPLIIIEQEFEFPRLGEVLYG
jgi:hypothetical protein